MYIWSLQYNEFPAYFHVSTTHLSDEPKIWAIITEVVAIVAEISGADEETLMMQIIADSRKLAALKAYAEAA